MSFPSTAQGSAGAYSAPSRQREPRIKRIARALLPLIVTTTVFPPASFAAPSPSLLSQQPDYVTSAVDPNVALILDDSRSMEDIVLAMPPGLTPGGSPLGTVTIRGRAADFSTTSGWAVGPSIAVNRDLDWLIRSSAFNPLYYNPAVTYRPWNDNGRGGAVGRFTDAAVGSFGAPSGNQFRQGVTRQDMRYVGPNRTTATSTAVQQADLSTATGANPPSVPDSIALSTARFTGTISGVTLTVSAMSSGVIQPGMAVIGGGVALNTTITAGPAAGGIGSYTVTPSQTVSSPVLMQGSLRVRPVSGGFAGATDGSTGSVRNQDLFSSLMVQANGGAQTCTVTPTSASTIDRGTTARDSIAQFSSDRIASPRPSTPLTLSNRGETTRASISRSTTPRDTVPRASTPSTTGGGTITTRDSRDLIITDRAITDRTLGVTTSTTSRLSTRPAGGLSGTTNRFEQDRATSPLPSTFTRAVTGRPSSTIATSPRTTEPRTSTAPSVTFTRATPERPSVALGAPSDRTITARPTQWRWEEGICGPFGAPNLGPWRNAPPPDGVTCANPGAESTPAQIETRLRPCADQPPAEGGPAETWGATQCISSCPSGTIASGIFPTGTQCLAQCAGGENLIAGRCYQACPSGYTTNGSAATATQCIETCPSTHDSNTTQCVGKCPTTHPNLIAGTCYGACSSSTGFAILGSAASSTQCVSNCPTGQTPDNLAPNTQCVSTQCNGTGQYRDGATCYTACGSGTALLDGLSTATQCKQTCDSGTHDTVGDQCVGKCPSGSTTISPAAGGVAGTCYAGCPTISGLASSPISGNEPRCRTNCPSGTTSETATQCIGGACTGNVIGGVCYGACTAGTSLYPTGNATTDTQCRTANGTCPFGTTETATACVGGGCELGFSAVGAQCYSVCPAGTSVYGADNTKCIAACPGDTTERGTTQCQKCPAGFPTLPTGATTCYAGCTAPAVVNPVNVAQCIACASGTPDGSGTCSGICPPTHPNLIGGTCYGACGDPANYAVLGSSTTSTQCKRSCPTGTGLNSTDSQCLGACPADFPGLETPTSTTCYANCGSIVVDGVPLASSPVSTSGAGFAQCRTDCPSGQIPLESSTTQCRQASCSTGEKIGLNCYTACGAGTVLHPVASASTTCLSTCPGGWETINPTTAGATGTCWQPCPTDKPNLHTSSRTCYANCSANASFPNDHPTNVALCMANCPAGAATSGTTQCRTCPEGNSLFNTNTQCCPSGSLTDGNCPAPDFRPPGFTCAVGNFVPNLELPALAHYYVYAPPASGGCAADWSSASASCRNNPANFVQVELNRDRKSKMVEGVSTPIAFPKAAGRVCDKPLSDGTVGCYPGQCAGTTCTWDEEAQNFANWYAYYRTRLAAAIGVTSASLSGLTVTNSLDRVRLAYGSLNFFPNGVNPYAAAGCDPSLAACRYATSMSLDGVSSNGHLVRGVRPFNQVLDPSTGLPSTAPFSGDARQEVFDWLFSLRTIGATPAREAYDTVGRYFSRSDSRGPWIQSDGTMKATDPLLGGESPSATAGRWSSSEASGEHFACRRNYLIMVSDGEWTRDASSTTLPQQPLVENISGVTLNQLSEAGPTITGLGSYTYTPSAETQFSTNARSSFDGRSNTGGTLSDIAMFYWARDLREDLANAVKPIGATAGSQGNPAFWQHMTAYLVGYGVNATADTADTRSRIIQSAGFYSGSPSTMQTIDWPAVRMENRPSEGGTVVTDRDVSPIDCKFSNTNLSGCGRVNDTFRAAMIARGDFLAAPSVEQLKQGIVSSFQAIGTTDASSTSIAGSSSSIKPNARFFSAGYRTSTWIGRFQSFDANDYFAFESKATSTQPTPANARFPAAASRNILTSDDEGAGKGKNFDFSAQGMSPSQKAALANNATLLAWLRGDQSVEQRNGGGFRNRPDGELLGTIVNSQPIYSKVQDAGYRAGRAPAAASSSTAVSEYRTHVKDNGDLRPARVFVSSNAGMLHAFDAEGSPVSSASNYNANHLKELFAYVPRATYANNNLSRLASPTYTHRYLVDGPIVEGDVYTTVGSDTKWRSVIVGTTGAGPKGVFALDVTLRPSAAGATAPTFGTDNVLWDVTAADTNQGSGSANALLHLGHILQPGVIASGKDGKWYYFVGNGYESTNDKARLLAIDMSDGKIRVIGPASGQPDDGGSNPSATTVENRPNGLGGITPVYDVNRNVIAVYAGDRLGRLWKFDLSSTNPADWSGSSLFVAHRGTSSTDPAARQPISAAPRLTAHPFGGRMVVFGTGKLHEQGDTSSSEVQTVYAVWDKSPFTAPSAVTAKTSLQQLTLTNETVKVGSVTTTVRKLNGIENINWQTGSTQDQGWYFDLQVGSGSGGERVIVSPTEDFGFVNVTSFAPVVDNNPCGGTGKSYFYRLDVAGTFSRPPFTGISAATGSTLPPLSSLIGGELAIGTPTQAVPLRPSNTSGATGGSTTLSASTITSSLGASATVSSAISNPCGGGVPGFLPQLNCPQAALRVWRDLPRGAQ